jgi:hypothetical protein
MSGNSLVTWPPTPWTAARAVARVVPSTMNHAATEWLCASTDAPSAAVIFELESELEVIRPVKAMSPRTAGIVPVMRVSRVFKRNPFRCWPRRLGA